MSLKCKLLEFGSLEQMKTVDLRDKILRQPLGLSFSPDELIEEFNQLHFAAYENNNLVACLVLLEYGEDKMKMRQVAVDDICQGRGLGTYLVMASEAIAKEHGKKIMFCHARATAVPFYESLEYSKVGEEFTEVGLPHFKMEKKL